MIEAVRVPPSACSTSQSTVIWRSPSATRSTAVRSERPIRRWISTVRPLCLPAEASRRVRSSVARGSMPYSAVTQPRPWPFSQGGRRSSSVAVTSTWVSPNFTRQEPSAYLTTPRSSETGRSSSGARRLGRMGNPPRSREKWLAVLLGAGGAQRQGLLTRARGANARLSPSTRDGQIRGDCEGVTCGPTRSDRHLIAPHAGLAQLNERSRDIFRQIVENYLATGEPVGSRNISRLITMPLSPASVRNVMSDLEQLGLIYAPHTSAGRLPTELGLRFFVDALMQVGDLTEAERQSIQSQLASVGRAQSVEAALSEALTRLSGLTRAAAVVLTAKSNVRLKHIEFVRLEPERALVVLVGEDGQVENRVLPLPPGVPTSALTEASNFLNARIRGRTLAEARLELETALTQSRAELDQLTQKVIAAGPRELVRRRQRRAPADRARPRQSARRSACAGGSRTGAIAVRRSRGQARRDRSARPRRTRRRRAHLHRLGEQAVLAVGLLDHHRALSRRRRPYRRRARRDRPDPAELCAGHPDGGLRRAHRQPAAGRLSLAPK